MSVLIKGMEMPTLCEDCPIFDEEELNCKLIGAVPWVWKEKNGCEQIHPRPDNCPIIALPLHGRLIDADALESHIFNKWLEDEISNKEWLLIRKLIQEPTIEERKTGRWLLLDGVRCSNCNHKLQTTGLPTVCPNCGAKMEV